MCTNKAKAEQQKNKKRNKNKKANKHTKTKCKITSHLSCLSHRFLTAAGAARHHLHLLCFWRKKQINQ